MAMPYIKIEPADYLNNYAINNLSCEEIGALFRILLLMWQADMQLQNDDVYIGRQLNIDPARWSEIKSKLDHLNLVYLDGAGNLMNSALKSKFHAAEAFSKQQRDKKQGRKKKPTTD